MEPPGDYIFGRPVLLLNATQTANVTTLEGSDFWETFSLTSIIDNHSYSDAVTFQATLCMTSFMAQNLYISATRSSPVRAEPSLQWDATKDIYNFDYVFSQFGSKNENMSERGIFNLEERRWVWDDRPEYPSINGAGLSTTLAIDNLPAQIWGLSTNEVQAAFFRYLIETTANPAFVLQSFYTMLMTICYYESLIKFDDYDYAGQLMLTPVLQPTGWAAYIAVVGVVVLHLILTFAISIMFAVYGKLSIVGNAWTVISQGSFGAADPWVKEADLVTDKTIKKRMKARGSHEQFVYISQCEGRVQLVNAQKLE